MDLDLQGWIFEAEQKWLFEIAYHLPDHATIVEIGSWKGLSTSNLCLGCMNSHKKIYAVDTWQGIPGLKEAYTTAVEMAIRNGELVEKTAEVRLKLVIPYALLEGIVNFVEAGYGRIIDKKFGQNVMVTIAVNKSKVNEFVEKIESVEEIFIADS